MSIEHPPDYKAGFGFYRATLRGLEALLNRFSGWWLRNALEHAENSLNDPALRAQLAQVIGTEAVGDLLPAISRAKVAAAAVKRGDGPGR